MHTNLYWPAVRMRVYAIKKCAADNITHRRKLKKKKKKSVLIYLR